VTAAWRAEFPLVGPAGEVVDLRRVFLSHGIAELPPMRLDQKAWTFELTVPLTGLTARTVVISQARPGDGVIVVTGRPPTPRVGAAIMAQVRHVLSLALDLTPFYTVAAEDPDLAWVLNGAGRMVRSPTVFEDVVKTICTTNTSWGGTTRMVNALVEHLGEKAPGAPPTGPYGRAFPTPEAMAAAPNRFYKKLRAPGIEAPTSRRWPKTSHPGGSSSKASRNARATSCPTTKSPRSCRRCRALAPTPRRTSC
jgi:hypothetical protein